MYEHRHLPLLSRPAFLKRVLWHFAFAMLMIGGSLGVGAVGYHCFESLSWLDATLNAAMILTGMGPVDMLHTAAGKLFATFYALFSGIVFLAAATVVIAPLAHRLMHAFHLEDSPSSPDLDDT